MVDWLAVLACFHFNLKSILMTDPLNRIDKCRSISLVVDRLLDPFARKGSHAEPQRRRVSINNSASLRLCVILFICNCPAVAWLIPDRLNYGHVAGFGIFITSRISTNEFNVCCETGA